MALAFGILRRDFVLVAPLPGDGLDPCLVAWLSLVRGLPWEPVEAGAGFLGLVAKRDPSLQLVRSRPN